MERLAGKRALVTAAGQGIGRATALAMAAEGAHVFATDVNPDTLAELKSASSGTLEVNVLDVLDESSVTEGVAHANPDILFNGAGFVHHGSILEAIDADWEFALNLNVRSMLRTIQAALPGMLQRGTGSIINMSSACSSVIGAPNRFIYGTTKAAVIGLTKAIAADFVAQNLRCNALCPGTVDTPALQGRIAAAPDPIQAEKDFIARQPMGRLSTVGDLTPTIVHLLSDNSSFMTGQSVLVDGGCTI